MKLFIWDFHGTLETGNERSVVEASNLILERNGYAGCLTEEICRAMYGKKWFEIFSFLLPEASHEQTVALQEQCFTFLHEYPEILAKNIRLVDHAIEVLETIKQNHEQILVSNTKQKSLKLFAELTHLLHVFPEEKLFGADAHLGVGTKRELVEKFLEKNSFDELIVIGDSPGDMELGAAIGATTFLYTHPELEFKECTSHYKIHDLREILKVAV